MTPERARQILSAVPLEDPAGNLTAPPRYKAQMSRAEINTVNLHLSVWVRRRFRDAGPGGSQESEAWLEALGNLARGDVDLASGEYVMHGPQIGPEYTDDIGRTA